MKGPPRDATLHPSSSQSAPPQPQTVPSTQQTQQEHQQTSKKTSTLFASSSSPASSSPSTSSTLSAHSGPKGRGKGKRKGRGKGRGDPGFSEAHDHQRNQNRGKGREQHSHSEQRAAQMQRQQRQGQHQGHRQRSKRTDPESGNATTPFYGKGFGGSKKLNTRGHHDMLDYHDDDWCDDASDDFDHPGNGAARSSRHRHKGSRSHWSQSPKVYVRPLSQEEYLQATCTFHVRNTYDIARHLSDPDHAVPWGDIEQVVMKTRGAHCCPICLDPPLAAKITRCGHIFCWPCILHHLATTSRTFSNCPLCEDVIAISDLRSVVVRDVAQPTAHKPLTFTLMARRAGATVGLPLPPQDEIDGIFDLHRRRSECGAHNDSFVSGGVEHPDQSAMPTADGHDDDDDAAKKSSTSSDMGVSLPHKGNSVTLRATLEPKEAEDAFLREYTSISPSLYPLLAKDTLRRVLKIVFQPRKFVVANILGREARELLAEEGVDEDDLYVHEARILLMERLHALWPDSPISSIHALAERPVVSVACSGHSFMDVVSKKLEPLFLSSVEVAVARDNVDTSCTKNNQSSAPSHSSTPGSTAINASPLHASRLGSDQRPTSSAPSRTRRSPRGHNDDNCADDVVLYYQLQDLQPVFLHPINVRCLLQEYGSMAACPRTITAPVVEVENHTLDKYTRKKAKHLQHLSLRAPYEVVELDLARVLSKETLDLFHNPLQRRKQLRKKKKRLEAKWAREVARRQSNVYHEVIATAERHEDIIAGLADFLPQPQKQEESEELRQSRSAFAQAVKGPIQAEDFPVLAMGGRDSEQHYPSLSSSPSSLSASSSSMKKMPASVATSAAFTRSQKSPGHPVKLKGRPKQKFVALNLHAKPWSSPDSNSSENRVDPVLDSGSAMRAQVTPVGIGIKGQGESDPPSIHSSEALLSAPGPHLVDDAVIHTSRSTESGSDIDDADDEDADEDADHAPLLYAAPSFRESVVDSFSTLSIPRADLQEPLPRHVRQHHPQQLSADIKQGSTSNDIGEGVCGKGGKKKKKNKKGGRQKQVLLFSTGL